MFWASHKQREVAILILINTSASIKFRIVEMVNWLNLNMRPCWDLIRVPLASKANPWTPGLCYLVRIFWRSISKFFIYINMLFCFLNRKIGNILVFFYSCLTGVQRLCRWSQEYRQCMDGNCLHEFPRWRRLISRPVTITGKIITSLINKAGAGSLLCQPRLRRMTLKIVLNWPFWTPALIWDVLSTDYVASYWEMQHVEIGMLMIRTC